MNLDAAITKESAAGWAAFLGNLSKAVAGAQQRVNDRHPQKQSGSGESGGRESESRERDARPSGRPKQDTKPIDKPTKIDKPDPGKGIEIGPKT